MQYLCQNVPDVDDGLAITSNYIICAKLYNFITNFAENRAIKLLYIKS